jgi:hypothetical protein
MELLIHWYLECRLYIRRVTARKDPVPWSERYTPLLYDYGVVRYTVRDCHEKDD